MQRGKRLTAFIHWREKHLDEKYFIIILSVLISFVAGLVVYLIKTLVSIIQKYIAATIQNHDDNYLYFVLPAIGIFLTVIIVKYVIRDSNNQGIPYILFGISKRQSTLKLKKLYSSVFGSSITAGFGGSVGLESPVIASGSVLGSQIGTLFGLTYKQKTLLIGCGAAGAIASIFTSPVAAVVFGIEVLMLDLTTASIVPLLFASGTGAITTKLLLADSILFNFDMEHAFQPNNLLLYLILGLFCGLVSIHFNRTHFYLNKKLGEIKNIYTKIAIEAAYSGY